MLGDVFYIDMNSCDLSANLETVVSDLKKAIESGVTKVIIDVRGNLGGTSEACVRLLEAMGMREPSYGGYVRFSKLSKQQLGTPSVGFRQTQPNKATAVRNEKIRLVVLTDEVTFSAATAMGVYVQDGDLGILIGRPSSNSPTNYGDVLYYTLPNSGVFVGISYKQFLRPDTEADQKTLMPDILTDYGEDALQVAIEYLSK